MMLKNDRVIPNFDDEKNESLAITLEPSAGVDNCVTVNLDGSIDTANSAFFLGRGTKIIDSGFVNLIFDCGNLADLSSTGVGVFAALLRMVRRRGGDLVLTGAQPRVCEKFRLLGFAECFTLKGDREEAVAFLQRNNAIAGILFPKTFACPVCRKNLAVRGTGRFLCPECGCVMGVNDQGQILLG
ncbi:MAG: STAS domain-containing protein [Spirochaetaceae bacterium]|jgi:anti-anti-sigma factor|nr:STAS domain-containing protein [Spirochaetaceae bacterium]